MIGAGPGGLYFAALAKQLDPSRDITVWERNAPDDTFGFGVVFSDETLGGIEHADPVIHDAMAAEFARWDDIDIHYRGRVITSGGHGFAALSRVRLLQILQARCRDLGVTLRFHTTAPDVGELRATHDLVVAADGVHSTVRTKLADAFRPAYDSRACRYIWLGSDKVFDAFTFDIRDTAWGVMQVHAYPYDARGSTLIVEMHDDVWSRAGFATEPDPVARCASIFDDLLDGHRLLENRSRWISFTTVRCDVWHHENVVLLGDAAHTAHFSIGSGTKLAMEDALALAACLSERPSIASALAGYEEERRLVVVSTQRAAQASLEWFENLGQYTHQDPEQFAFNVLSRSRRVTYDNLRLRDPEFVASVDEWFARSVGDGTVRPPMFHPFRLRSLELANRIIVSPMDMYVATDGLANDFHLVHLGGKALGGAGLVMTEMVCVSPEGRITPGCTGLWTSGQGSAWARVVDFVHEWSGAAIGVQLGHSGRKGSTKLMWEGMDQPLDAGNWPVVGPSALPYSPVNQVPRELTVADLAEIRAQFVAAARRAEAAGFDLLELHCAHGYLLSSFISPLTNTRTDRYGGALANRLRFPLEVFDEIRAVWPDHKPMTVRISATDWHPGGITGDDAVLVAEAFTEHGVDAVDVSTGQVVPEERPAYGRSYQTPYADAIRNRLRDRVAVIAVGAISSYDDVNSLILAGRADLCALGRTHLYDPQWTLHAAAEQEYPVPWPLPYAAGRRRPQTGRTDGPKPRLELVRDADATRTRHARWRPHRQPR